MITARSEPHSRGPLNATLVDLVSGTAGGWVLWCLSPVGSTPGNLGLTLKFDQIIIPVLSGGGPRGDSARISYQGPTVCVLARRPHRGRQGRRTCTHRQAIGRD